MKLRVVKMGYWRAEAMHASLVSLAGSFVMAALVAAALPQSAQAQWALAEGGTVTQITDEGVAWVVHTFTDVGTSELTVTQEGQIEYLIVGGGGGGASVNNWSAGGGGGGGVEVGASTVSAGAYQVTVGAGGTGETPTDNAAGRATAGQPSSAFSVTANGGVAAARQSNANLPGGPGAGGTSGNANGGPGVETSITGDSVRYAGGGGTARSGGVAGTGTDGGGNARTNGNGLAGLANRGGGGGGGRPNFPGGGNGGSGIVMVRYQLSQGAILVVR